MNYNMLLILIFCFSIICTMTNESAAQSRVNDLRQLEQVLSDSKGGERIELAPGNYGALRLVRSALSPLAFSVPVTIRSADPAQPASFTSIDLRNVQNVTFENLDLRYRFSAGDDQRARPFRVRDSRNIAFLACRFAGDLSTGTGTPADGFGNGIGLDVVGSTGIRLEDSLFESWHRGAVFARSRDLNIKGNKLRGLRSDGLNFAEVSNVVIERNTLTSFKTSLRTGDHPDMIQFWTGRTKSPSTDILIKDNILDIGDGDWTQSIFMRNEEVDSGRAGPDMYYRNVQIIGNFIRNGHVHGITVGETNGLLISNNTLLQSNESPRILHLTVPAVNVKPNSTDVRIVNNVGARFPDNQAGWRIEDNFRVQRNFPARQDFYNAVFVDAMAPGAAPLDSFAPLPAILPGSPPPGSPLIRFNERPARPKLVILSSVSGSGRSAQHKFALAAYGPAGKIDLSGAVMEWDLGGTLATGPSPAHRFAAPGTYQARVTVTLQSGERMEAAQTLVAP